MTTTSALAAVASALGLAWLGIGLAVLPAESHADACTDAPEYVLADGGSCGRYDGDTSDPFDQRNFPCNEDEVLGYAPSFGSDRVGCIHIDNLR